MEFQEDKTEQVPVQLPNGTVIKVEVSQVGREDVAFDLKPFAGIASSIEGIVEAIAAPIQNAKPDKASVKFGLEIGIEQGQLVAAIVKGASRANLEITLEWNK